MLKVKNINVSKKDPKKIDFSIKKLKLLNIKLAQN
jgi:hypothetical protein